MKIGSFNGDEELYVSFVTVDDPQSAGGFVFGLENSYGSYDEVLRELGEKIKNLPQAYFVGTSVCNMN